MKFSYRSRLVILALVLSINAFVAIHNRNDFSALILVVVALLAVIIPESPEKNPKPENSSSSYFGF